MASIREREVEHLGRAEADIADGERRVTQQGVLVEQLRSEGRDASHAEALLATMRGTLAAWVQHRDTILQRLAEIEGEPDHPP